MLKDLPGARIILRALPILTAVTLIYGAVYTLLQQNYRQNANDPQVEMAEDIAKSLSTSADPNGVLPSTNVDLSSSLAPFVIIYNESGEFQVGNGTVNGDIPELPKGVLTDTKNNSSPKVSDHENRVTWETKEGLRFATVVKYYSGEKSGYVLVGRSLRLVEDRIETLGRDVLLAWIGTVSGVLLAYYLRRKFHTKTGDF